MVAQAGVALLCERYRAVACLAVDPVKLDHPGEQDAANGTGEVMVSFGPVHAVAHDRPFWQDNAEVGEECLSSVAQVVVDVVAVAGPLVPVGVVGAVAAGEVATVDHGAHESDTETAGEVVVAGAGLAQLLGSGALPQRADRLGRGEPAQVLDELADSGVGDPVVAVSPVCLDGQQSAVHQLAKVVAGGGGSHAGLGGQPGGRQRLAAIESHQDAAAGTVREQGSDGGDVDIAAAPILAVRRGAAGSGGCMFSHAHQSKRRLLRPSTKCFGSSVDAMPFRNVSTSGLWWPFTAAAYTLIVLLAGTNVPTALYSTYEKQFGYAPLVTTLVFAVYALVLVPSLLIFGPLSDAVGRRRVLIPAVALAIVGSVIFASGPVWLFVARAIQGITLGAAQGTASAALTETDPDQNTPRAALAGSLAVVAGGGLGPLLGGLLAQYAPAPLILPYLVEVALLALALAALIRYLPRGGAPAQRWQPRRPTVPASIRRTFAIAGTTAFLAWAVTALFLALMPSYVITVTGTTNLALAGGVVTLLFACSGASQLVLRRLSTLTAQTTGLALLVVGLGGIIAAAQTGSLALVLTATVLAGLGQGLAFGGSLAEITAVAPADRRGDIVSSYYVIVYVGVALPVIGVGFIALATGLLPAIQIFAAAVAAACLAGILAQRLDARRPDRLSPATQ